MTQFVPVPFMAVRDPRQLKAFTDPLRLQVLGILVQDEATNQQIADALGEPHAKVLHHVRFLLDAGLIQLVDTRIKGGNVEKYYRAVARLFGMRPTGDFPAEDLLGARFQVVQQEVIASQVTWPDQWLNWEMRKLRLPEPRAREFYQRLIKLIAEYWGGPDTGAGGSAPAPEEDPASPVLCFASVIYRDPTEASAEADTS